MAHNIGDTHLVNTIIAPTLDWVGQEPRGIASRFAAFPKEALTLVGEDVGYSESEENWADC